MPYRRALDAGAETIAAPEDKPYGERGCGFRAFGNTWWVATYWGDRLALVRAIS